MGERLPLSATYYLEAATSFFTPPLISPEALAYVKEVAAFLPTASSVVLECRLEADASAVDFIPRFTKMDGSTQFFSNRSLLPDIKQPHPIWSRIHDFYVKQGDPANPRLWNHVWDTWLEFDIDGPPAPVPIPSFYTGKLGMDKKSNLLISHEEHKLAVKEVLDILFDSPVSGPIWQNIEACYAALPETGVPFAVGMMLPRTTKEARFVIIGIPASEVTDFLVRAGWPGERQELEPLLRSLSRLTDLIGVSLNIGETVDRQVGFECFLQEYNPAKEPRWGQFVNYLIEKELCTPEKGQALLAWYGHFGLDPRLEKYHYTPHDAAKLRQTRMLIFRRELSHLKVVFQADGRLKAKGYLDLRAAKRLPAKEVVNAF